MKLLGEASGGFRHNCVDCTSIRMVSVNPTRRDLLRAPAAAAALPAFAAEQDFPRTVPEYERPLFDW